MVDTQFSVDRLALSVDLASGAENSQAVFLDQFAIVLIVVLCLRKYRVDKDPVVTLDTVVCSAEDECVDLVSQLSG